MTGRILRALGRYAVRLLPAAAYPVLFGPLKGARFILGSFAGEGRGATAFVGLLEPNQVEHFVKKLKKGDVVFDVGANVGFYTILASRLVGDEGLVVAFEPLPKNLEFLERHLVLNKVTNVKVMPYACSDRAGSVSFFHGPNRAMGSIKAVGGEEVRVECVTLDDLAAELAKAPNIVKIDVEGAETEVLSGGIRTLTFSHPALFLSTHSAELRDECMTILSRLGYRSSPLVSDDDPFEFLFEYQTEYESLVEGA